MNYLSGIGQECLRYENFAGGGAISGEAGYPRREGGSGLGLGERVEFDDAVLGGPGLPVLDHALDALGVLGGEVVEFAAVGREVVKLPRLAVAGDQFPGALADGLMALMLPI